MLVWFSQIYLYPIEYQYHLVVTLSGSHPGSSTTQIKKMSRPPKDPTKKIKTEEKKTQDEGTTFANPPLEDPLVDEPS